MAVATDSVSEMSGNKTVLQSCLSKFSRGPEHLLLLLFSLSVMSDSFATPMTVFSPAPLSMRFQWEYRVSCHFLLQLSSPNPGIKLAFSALTNLYYWHHLGRPLTFVPHKNQSLDRYSYVGGSEIKVNKLLAILRTVPRKGLHCKPSTNSFISFRNEYLDPERDLSNTHSTHFRGAHIHW